jgi:hypothetical protein
MNNGLYNGTLPGMHNGLYSNEAGYCNFIPLYKPKLVLNFSNGNSVDTSGNGVVITDTNMAYSPVYGKFGGGALFNTSQLAFGSLSTGTNYTISFWIKPIGGTTYACIFGSGSGGMFYRNDLKRMSMYFGGDRLSTFIVPLNIWSFVVMSSFNSVGTWYLNGLEYNKIATINYNALFIGNDVQNEKLIGYMDSIRLDSYAWTSLDVKRYYEQSKNRIINYGE